MIAERREDGVALIFCPFVKTYLLTDRHPLIIFPKTWNELEAPTQKTISSKNVFNN
jgi:hypothetical protein